jgi:hypothetical protein
MRSRSVLVSTPIRLAVLAIVLLLYFSELRKSDPRPSDFAAFYSAAILWEQGGQPFRLASQCEIQARVGVPICLPFFHPPVLLPLLSLVSTQDYSASYLRWVVVLALVLIGCGLTIQRLVHCDLLDLALYLTFFPIFVVILQGQDTPFVLLGVLMCALFLRDGRDTLAGIALGLVVLRPHIAIAIAVPLLFSRIKAFRSFLLTGLILLAYSFALVGREGFYEVFNIISVTAKGADPTIKQTEMYNLVGLFTRWGLSPLWGWLFFGACIIGVSILWRNRGVTLSNFAFAVLCIVFTSPHLHAHDLSLLILPMLSWPAAIASVISIGFVVAILIGLQHPFVYGLGIMVALNLKGKRLLRIVRSAKVVEDSAEL